MRLDKYLCESTPLTRSQAKKVISQGRVKSGDQVVRSCAYKATADESIYLDDNLISVRGLRYIMINKPKDFICSNVDEQLPSLFNLIDAQKKEQLFIAGRLDADTTGLALITDDGQWSHKVTSPRNKCKKRYRVELNSAITEEAIEQLKVGVQLNSEPQPCLPATVEVITETEVILTISEGKYHQVKRMFAAVGNLVIELHREQIGDIILDANLELGEWRYLTESEVQSIG
ncbi:16S rRNA pseudouridine(516) synthase [Psychromonas sp. psych-6C06]|uniref:pseudouridine synthase n=1 Tax=Psychromonas sp. psych-6C06 TaxID=2058089 RepID=UPI000C33EFE9|nr:pseudouridine synthase [Psychromonas sp. psych-6C06]PKF60832.1 16S rRNA pseudouridine(516) synthase [Psychromonas sp. psych-6C06]